MLKTTVNEKEVVIELYDNQGKFRDALTVSESEDDWSMVIKTEQNVGVELAAE